MYVETGGSPDAPALVYLHGGPGAGGYDFTWAQGARLIENVRLIVFDQRGVLRSAPLADEDSCTLHDLVEDLEALREDLRLRRWSFIGHSFGGYLGLSYAMAYPDSVDCAIFENSTFDIASSGRELLRGAAEVYDRLGDHANAQACREAAEAPTDTRTTWERFSALVNSMPERDSLYVHGPDKGFFNRLVETSGLSQEQWARGGAHQRKLFAEGAVFNSLLPRLPELRAKALLIHGAYDRVTAPDQIAAFTAGPQRTLATFENSSHFAHVEEPARFAQTVSAFVTG